MSSPNAHHSSLYQQGNSKMSLKIAGGLCICLVLAALIFYRSGSSKPTNPQPATADKAEPAKPGVDPVRPQPPAKPAPAEISAVVQRIYKDAAIVDDSREVNFTVGDFNGDDSQDIAIMIKPVKSKLSDLNSEYVSWTLEDPRALPPPDAQHNSDAPIAKPAPVKIKQQDSLLTIVHGYQQTGWRNPAATQTYLLRNSIGADLQMETGREALRRIDPKEKVRPLSGDVIREKLSGESGFLYWTGSKYAWQKTVE
jgi:hypothetical protein